MKGKMALDRKGFTLVEVLIALGIAGVVMAAVYTVYNYYLKTSTGQERKLEIQQESRIAMERLSKDTRAAGCYYKQTPVLQAGAGVFEFEADTDPDPARGPWKIKYEIDAIAKTLKRSSGEWNSGTGSYNAYSTQVLASHITGLQFNYYDAGGNVTADPALIRKVDIQLTATTDYINPATRNLDTITLNTSVYPRCIGVQQSTDTTACAAPNNIQVSDPGICGRLNVTWTKSTSSDAAGYKIFYRPHGASFYSGAVEVPGKNTQAYTLAGLENGVQYDVALKCYDTSGNYSDYAGCGTDPFCSGTANPVNTRPNDVTAPDIPAGTDATAGNGFVNLTWTASSAVDTGGYSIYRSANSGSTYTKISSVDSTHLSYRDLSAQNCPAVPYYYKVTAWDCAGNEQALAYQTAVFGDGAKAGGITDMPRNGVTNTNPTETIAPADPVNFVAVAGANKIYLSYASPLDTDVNGVRILRRTDTYPTGYNDGGAVGPNGVSDYTAVPNQTYSLVDSSGIINGTTYYYRAFAYDGCLNYSPGTVSQATARPCGDGTPGSKHYGPPSAPGSPITGLICGAATLSWPASAGSENGNTFNPPSESDVVGYNIYRSTTSGVYGASPLNNGGPVTSTTYTDSTVVPGNTYYYVIRAVDCANNQSTVPSSEIVVKPSGVAWDTSLPVITYGTSGLTGSQHNIVKFAVKNLGTSDIVLNTGMFKWVSFKTAFLKKVIFKPFGGTATTIWDNSTGPYTISGGTVDFVAFGAAESLRTLAAGSTLNELQLEFRESGGGGFVDMRGDTITPTFGYKNTNPSPGGSACTSSSFSVPVLAGPTIGNTIQNRPVDPTTANLNPATNVIIAGTQDASYVWTLNTVAVQATITPEAGTTLSTEKLYYSTTARTVSTPPATDYTATPAGWTAITMCLVGTDTYQTNNNGSGCTSAPIPANAGKRVWYYIKAVDGNNNYDIQPEPSVGIYTYDQESKFNISLTLARNNQGGTNTAAVTAVLTDENSAAVAGAAVSVTITGTNGTNLTAAAVEGPAGTYTYTGNNMTDLDLNAAVIVSKTGFTNALCGVVNVDKTKTGSKICN